MTEKSPLDQSGNFQNFPLAELLIEIEQAKFSGRLRLSHSDKKTILYFDMGDVIFGVSNSRELRLFNVMLQQKKIDKSALMDHTSFANDLEFAQSLQINGGFAKEAVDGFITDQIDAIILDALLWPDGEWHFSPLARLRSDVRYPVRFHDVLMNYARCIPTDVVLARFRSVKEAFSPNEERINDCHQLQAHEAYVLGRFVDESLTIEQLRGMSSLPEAGLLQALYVLWLGGLLRRRDWSAAFTPRKIGEILSARIVRVKTAKDQPALVSEEITAEPSPEPEAPIEESPKAAEIKITVEEYLERVESAKTHYDTLGITAEAETAEIRSMYFGLAKLFHPDKFHRESEIKQKRIQAAFTILAHAYETLKNDESREAYDFKMRKEIDARDKRRAEGASEDDTGDVRTESALESFEQGLSLLNQDDYEQAVVLLGRAVHYSPENAQFQAYYGLALSAFEGQEHKAEAALQKAAKLDPKNPKIRMMLVDFFIEIDLKKRAIGELNRFLELVPENKDAMRRLEKLSNT